MSEMLSIGDDVFYPIYRNKKRLLPIDRSLSYLKELFYCFATEETIVCSVVSITT